MEKSLEPIDVLNEINEKIERIKSKLPDKGRRLHINSYLLPRHYFNVLMKNLEFKMEAEKGNPNIGGIPVKIIENSDQIRIDCYQEEKQRKYFRKEIMRKKKDAEKEENLESKSF